MMHASRPRNRLIAQALYDMGVIEHYGRGIKRIKEECDRNGNPYPDWTDRPGEFLTIYKARGGEEVQAGQHRELNEGNEGNREGNPVGNEGNLERVFNAIKSNPHATIAELENVPGVSHATVERAQKPCRRLAEFDVSAALAGIGRCWRPEISLRIKG